jgi:hypothetical protein
MELVWLTGRLMPDLKTIADFRKNNGAAIRAVTLRSSLSGLRQSCKTSVGWKRADGSPRPLYQMQHLLKETNNGDTDFGR